MNAVVCACGRRIERVSGFPNIEDLRTATHDPDECSRAIGYQSRLDGRVEMVEPFIAQLAERRSIARRVGRGGELAEIRTNLLDLTRSLPLGPVKR